MEKREVYQNVPQQIANLVNAQHARHVWSRGMGKSEWLLAPRMVECVFAMPRSLGVLEGATYNQILTRTLPRTVAGLEKMGYVMNRDFFVGHYAPKAWKWELPFAPPLKSDHIIHWRNGTVVVFISQDRPGSANGLSIDFYMNDEAKYLKKQQHDEEVVPAIRGNRHLFGGLWQHHSTIHVTDMPVAPKARWILDEEEKMDQEAVDIILNLQLEVHKHEAALLGKLSERMKKEHQRTINRYNKYLNELRQGLIHYTEANVFDNIHVLGIEYVQHMKRTLPDPIYRTAILNERMTQAEGGFYPDLDDELHTYTAYCTTHRENIEENVKSIGVADCRDDYGINRHAPIEIAGDFGSSFNCLVSGQEFEDEFRFTSDHWVKHPGKIKDVCRLWHDFYKYQPNRDVIFWYDHTMVGTDAIRDVSYKEEVRRELEKLGWNVDMRYIGQAASHHTRYLMWPRFLDDQDPSTPRFRFHQYHCETLLVAMMLAGVKHGGKNGFEKDKRPERDKAADQSETTHLTDAADLLAVAKFGTSFNKDEGLLSTVLSR